MAFLLRSRRLTLAVLVAYFAAHTLGAVLHEQLHAHAGTKACCHASDHAHQGVALAASHQHARPTTASRAPASHAPDAAIVATGAHDHACIVCRIAGQPLAAAQAVALDLTCDVSPDALPSPTSAAPSLAARLAHSRAPPVAS